MVIQVKHFRGCLFEEEINEWISSHREYVIKDVKYTVNKYGTQDVLVIYEVVDE